MRARHRDGVAPPLCGRKEFATVALKPEHVHPGNAGMLHALAEFGLHGAEVFADDNRAMAMRFERDQRSRSSSGYDR
jgi:hypothetical protein